MKQDIKSLLFLILAALVISNVYFFYNNRLFISTSLIDPLSINDTLETFPEDIKEINNEFKNYTNIEFIPSNKIEQFNIKLYANLLRFFQNNKSYKYLYIKEKELNSKQKKKFLKLVKNISLEGAYFLNYDYLSTVKIQYRSNSKKNRKDFNSYIQFIIKKEVDKYLSQNHDLFLNDRYYDWKTEIRKELNNKIDNLRRLIHLIEVAYYDEITFRKIYPSNERLLKKEYLDNLIKYFDNLNLLLDDPKGFANTPLEARNKLEFNYLENLRKIISHESLIFNQEKKSEDFKIFVLTKSNIDDFIFYQQHFKKTNFDFILNENIPKVIDSKKLTKKIFDSIVFVENKLNIKELVSLNIFSIIFSFVAFSLLRSFLRKN